MISLNKKIYFPILISVIIFLLLFFVVICPLAKKIISDSEGFMAEKNRFIELQERQENFRNLSRQYDNYEADFAKIDSFFVNSEKPIEFIEFLERNAQDSGLIMNISSIVPQKQSQDLWDFNIYNLILEGSFDDFCRFLEKIENAPYLIEVSNLDIKEDRANLGLKIYSK